MEFHNSTNDDIFKATTSLIDHNGQSVNQIESTKLDELKANISMACQTIESSTLVKNDVKVHKIVFMKNFSIH